MTDTDWNNPDNWLVPMPWYLRWKAKQEAEAAPLRIDRVSNLQRTITVYVPNPPAQPRVEDARKTDLLDA